MQKLIDGACRFHQTIFRTRKQLFERLAQGQHPLALFITCSDSRIDPNLLTQTEPGELFVLRTAGNIVPPYEAPQAGEAGTIEYAVTALRVPDIVVCGHSQCGAMAGLLDPESVAQMPAVAALLRYADPVRQTLKDSGAGSDDANRLNAAVEANVLLQLKHLRTHPSVAAALEQNSVRLHGWVYHFETGEVIACDARTSAFQPLQETDPPEASPRSSPPAT